MNDKDFLESLKKEYDETKHTSSIRIIADAIYEFLEKYFIEFNTLERERLCLYLVHYPESKKAAAHIYPINPSLKKIPNCVQKIAYIIEKSQEKILENDLVEQIDQYNSLFNETMLHKSVIPQKSSEEVKKRNKKISSIQSFIKKNEKKEG